MNNRDYTDARGVKRKRTDTELVEHFLNGWVDYYSGGAIEHLRAELDNLRTKTAELLLVIDQKTVVEHCEKN